MNSDYNVPIFLHFLNRELRETEGAEFSDNEVFDFLRVGTIISESYIYVGNALVWECYDLYPSAIKLLCLLEKETYACFVGNDMNIDSFIQKRRALYEHDKNRYPIYFSDNIYKMPWGSRPRDIKDDTTNILAVNVFALANGNEIENVESDFLAKNEISYIIRRLSFRKSHGTAVTFTLFKGGPFSHENESKLKKIMIHFFTSRYTDAFCGKYLTGISKISHYEKYQKCDFIYDFQINNLLFTYLGLIKKQFKSVDEEFYNLLSIKKDANYHVLMRETRKLLSGLNKMCENDRRKAMQIINQADWGNFELKSKSLLDAAFMLFTLSNRLIKANDDFKKGYDEMKSATKTILVLAATPLEFKIARDTANVYGFKFVDKMLKQEEFSYAECLEVDGVGIYIARTHMGPINSAVTIQELLKSLNIDLVIMGGICVGLKKKKQNIGDILISQQIINYDSAKLTPNGRISRGDKITSNRYLLDKLILESYEWTDSTIDSGLIASASVLANSQAFVKQIIEDEPDAIGYEMEGAGLIHSCNLLSGKWILAKAICDWGYQKSNENQELAASNSYRFIFNTIKNRIMQ